MLFRGSNYCIHIGYAAYFDGYEISLAWNSREGLGGFVEEGERWFVDEVGARWWPGRWMPQTYKYSMRWDET